MFIKRRKETNITPTLILIIVIIICILLIKPYKFYLFSRSKFTSRNNILKYEISSSKEEVYKLSKKRLETYLNKNKKYYKVYNFKKDYKHKYIFFPKKGYNYINELNFGFELMEPEQFYKDIYNYKIEGENFLKSI